MLGIMCLKPENVTYIYEATKICCVRRQSMCQFIFTFHYAMLQRLVAWQTFKSFRFDLPHKYTRGSSSFKFY